MPDAPFSWNCSFPARWHDVKPISSRRRTQLHGNIGGLLLSLPSRNKKSMIRHVALDAGISVELWFAALNSWIYWDAGGFDNHTDLEQNSPNERDRGTRYWRVESALQVSINHWTPFGARYIDHGRGMSTSSAFFFLLDLAGPVVLRGTLRGGYQLPT